VQVGLDDRAALQLHAAGLEEQGVHHRHLNNEGWKPGQALVLLKRHCGQARGDARHLVGIGRQLVQ